MPSVPTAAITPRNNGSTSVYGQARPCRTTTLLPKNTLFLQPNPLRKAKLSLKPCARVIKSKRANLDFHIRAAQHSPRLG
jgi:hypothetical protein